MKKTKKIFIAVVLCALVLLSAIPASALTFDVADYDGAVRLVFTGSHGQWNRTMVASVRGNVIVGAPPYGSFQFSDTFLDFWKEDNGDIVAYSDQGERIRFFYNQGGIRFNGAQTGNAYAYAIILCDTLEVHNQELFDIMFARDPSEVYDQGYDTGYSAGNQAGYDVGYSEGYEAGYTLGYSDGQEAAAAGDFKDGYQAAVDKYGTVGVKNIFEYMRLRLGWYVDDGSPSGQYVQVVTRPDVNGDEVTFITAYNDLVSFCQNNGYDVPEAPGIGFSFDPSAQISDDTRLSFLFTFNTPIVVVNDAGSSSLFMFVNYTNDQAEYPDETYNPVEVTIVGGVSAFRGPRQGALSVTGFTITAALPFSLPEFKLRTSITMSNSSYQAGYITGFNAGINANSSAYEEVVDNAYNRGYNAGYQVGKGDGIALNETDFFDLCFAVAQAPLDVLYGVFDFNILGFNMQAAIGSLATVCIVVFLVKFLLFFLS